MSGRSSARLAITRAMSAGSGGAISVARTFGGEARSTGLDAISPHLRACVDVGNYMGCGQEGHVGTAVAAPYAGYVHFKDNKKVPDTSRPWGWKVEACVIGEGAVDLPACVESLRKAGYEGCVALEYEGTEDETTGVPRSVEALKRLVK